MKEFKGFPDGKVNQTPIPGPFFSEILPYIDQISELKVLLYTFWRFSQMEGAFRCLKKSDYEKDANFLLGLSSDPQQGRLALDQALQQSVESAILLKASVKAETQFEEYYFLNSPKGRAALHAIEKGKWKPDESQTREPPRQVPNIYRLYEENIGPLTPLIAEALGDAQDTYPAEWIKDAIGISVENNKRSWRYITVILERWKQEGRHGKKEKPEDRGDSAEARRRYVEGEFSEFVEH